MLRISTATVYRQVQGKEWPSFKVGTEIRFKGKLIKATKEAIYSPPMVAAAAPAVRRQRVGTGRKKRNLYG